MKTLLWIEGIKLKRSPLILLSILGALTPPALILVGLIKANYIDQIGDFSFEQVLMEGNLYTTLLFYPILYSIIAAYLFTRDYTEQTLKTMFALPIEKGAYLNAKFILYFSWVLSLSILSFIAMIITAFLGGANGFSFGLLFNQFTKYIISSLLLSWTFTAIIFSAIRSKNLYLPLLLAASICLVNIFLSNEPFAFYFPFSYAYLITTSNQVLSTINGQIGLLVTLALGTLGYITTSLYFKRTDIL